MKRCSIAILFILAFISTRATFLAAETKSGSAGASTSTDNDISSNPAGVNTKHHLRNPGNETHNPANPGPLLPNSTGNQTDSHTTHTPPKGIPSDTDQSMHNDTGL